MSQSAPVIASAGDPLARLARYSGSSLVMRAFALAYAYTKPKFLEPALLGVWSLLNLVPTYGSYLHLGSRNALEFRVPKLLAEGREAEAAAVIGCVYRVTLAGNMAIAAGLLLLALFGGFDAATSFGLAALAPAMLLIWYRDQQLAVLKAEQRFELIANANLLKAATLITLGIPLVIWFGFPGVCVGFVLMHAIVATYLRWRCPMRRVGRFDRRIFFGLVREGAPVLAFVAGLTLLTTTDRMVIASLLGVEAVGFYSVALIAATFALQVPLSARDMLEPRLMASLAEGISPGLWRDYLLWPMLNAACYFPFVVGGLAFLADDLLAALLPRYLPSAWSAVVLCGGCYFLVQVQIARGILVANGWQLRVLPFHLASAAISVALSTTFVKLGWGIAGVALASSMAFAVAMTFILLYALRRSPLSPRDWLPVFATVFLAPAASVAILWGLTQLLGSDEASVAASLAGFLLFVLAQSFLVAGLRRVFPRIRPLPLPLRRRKSQTIR